MMEAGRKAFLLDEVCCKTNLFLRGSGRRTVEKLLVFCQSIVHPGDFLILLPVSFNICGCIWKGEAAFECLHFAENFKSKGNVLDKIQ